MCVCACMSVCMTICLSAYLQVKKMVANMDTLALQRFTRDAAVDRIVEILLLRE